MKKVPASFWKEAREDNLLVLDKPFNKLVVIPAQRYVAVFVASDGDGEVVMDMTAEEAERFANALLAILPETKRLTALADAEVLAHEVCQKAAGIA